MPREILAQAHALAMAEVAQLVIVIGADGRLAVANEIKGSHAAAL